MAMQRYDTVPGRNKATNSGPPKKRGKGRKKVRKGGRK